MGRRDKSGESAASDPYAPFLRALDTLRPEGGGSVVETAAEIASRLSAWDGAAHGDWRDAIAVAARRRGLHVRDPHTLLVRLLLPNLAPQRAAEVGDLLGKLGARGSAGLLTAVERMGGTKKAIKARTFPPPLKIRVRRKP